MISEKLLARAKKKGSEEQYYSWLRQCPSCLFPEFSEYVNGEGRCVVAHVRNVNGGIGYKPPYSAVPLTQDQHAKQHQYGYEYFMPIEAWSELSRYYLKKWIKGQNPTKLKQGSKIVFTLFSADQLIELVRVVKNWTFKRPLVVEIYQQQTNRTLQQNKAIWLLNNQIATELQKDKFKMEAFVTDHMIDSYDKLPKSSIAEMVHARNKFKYNKKTTTRLKKHNDGFSDSFEEYMGDIIHDMMRYGIHLDMPIKDDEENEIQK